MTQSSEWYSAMATRIKVRDHAINMIARWQAKLDNAEVHIKALSDGSYNFAEEAEEPTTYRVDEPVTTSN